MNQNTLQLSLPRATYTIFYLQGNHEPVPTLKKNRKALRKGERNRRILKTIVISGYEFSYHATRGWRKNKV